MQECLPYVTTMHSSDRCSKTLVHLDDIEGLLVATTEPGSHLLKILLPKIFAREFTHK